MSKFHQACQEPCIQYKYKTQATYIGFGQKDKTRVEIIYDSRSFTYHQYERTSTSCNFLSQLGGSLGFYLGASIVTVIEIVIFTLSWIWYKVSPFKNSKIQPSSNKKSNGLQQQKNSKHLSLSIVQRRVENFC
nr:acid-sensing ion channel 5-like [Parasteatoda tepidariorum]